MTCPICSRPTDPAYRPFCSRRCADVDLGRWLNGSYAVPSTDPDDVEEALDEAIREAERRDRPH
ncbi:DNA gyrase inhibitor YacG [uncultured Jannaschia sp.]|uniref:DNA gyrase inhibitor YacG n=1 Tax=uncultured Jannaschia sp. TaxID=293347 RepID=UPI00260ED605|nr:DNA gyrase inhibitor YacG [uncultured Jannaschia sp.]